MTAVVVHEDAGEDSAGDAVPCAADGARKDGEGLRGEEGGGEDGGKSGVLHAHLDGDGAALRGGEAGEGAGGPAQGVAQRVMAEDDGEGPEEECHASGDKVVVDGGDDTAYDTRQ